jgi:MFS family permease
MFSRLKNRYGATTLFAVGFLAMAVGHAVIAVSGSYGGIIAGVGISGFGMGLVMPNFSASALALASPLNRGRVAGYLSSAIFLGQFASPLVSQPVIATSGIAACFQVSAAMLGAVAAIMATRAIWSVRAPAV